MNKVIAALILFIAATCASSIAGAAQWWQGLTPLKVELLFEDGYGGMVARHTSGDHSDYENKWLPLSINDPDTGVSGSFEIWIKEWRGVCEVPCDVTVIFDIRNVNWSTK